MSKTDERYKRHYRAAEVAGLAALFLHAKITRPGHTGNISPAEITYCVDWAEKLVNEIEGRAQAHDGDTDQR